MRTVNRLTGNKVKKAKPGPEGRTALLCDGGGLWLQVGFGRDKQVTKSWIAPRGAPAGGMIAVQPLPTRRKIVVREPINVLDLAGSLMLCADAGGTARARASRSGIAMSGVGTSSRQS